MLWVTMRSTTKRKKSEVQSDVQRIADRYEQIAGFLAKAVPGG